ncbi:SURP and G-patch domain-containing protein 1-like [Paramacrobiotus metropolitanus]|uniref:SURP and G-patch domain-containing protein 1-like n=1 Tax=Paramacrobiotus metropolitanus TaxID=2943436 RepID=UPI0024457A8C|nr:SURP and G-patch domain-containing protein 1-like [Paramacrobiotus metropolitanus]XP_055354614.1 SURP and G-patch domain-containing protein 1-like [Paramacrobiotus metropolitanus]XP_055354615.1 SURP and G-patch domain-containing protein 1-like [Paramacrobiotus metropolitanus]XP_055354616.1 SURP and G-patch domain-containing protein 1-like [Paramacrobiotus metropolitanus]
MSQSIRDLLLAKKLEIEAKLAAAGTSTAAASVSGVASGSIAPAAGASCPDRTDRLGGFSQQGNDSSSERRSPPNRKEVSQMPNPNSCVLSENRRRIIDTLAQQFVLQGSFPPSTDRTETELSEFLQQPSNVDSLEYQYYQQRLAELRAQSSTSTQKTKKRVSRWGPSSEEVPTATADVKPVPCPLSDEQLHQIQLAHLKQQLASKDSMLKTKKVVLEDGLGVPSQEHVTRAAEMAKTKELAEQRTKPLHEGKHHLQDFLPKEELAKFQQKLSKEGAADVGQYEENKLTEDNVGFQMLKKFGWTEGQGLGASSSGIAAPISSTTSMERAGLGVKRPDEPSEEDDEFSLYRKRMMLAYKYRPNPLNNPRRPYY